MPLDIQLPDFVNNIEWGEKRNKIASVLSGFLFFSGWWFALDASISHHSDTRDVFQLCGVFSTISLFMVNAVSNSLLRGESFTEGCLGPVGARIWFFLGFMMGFASFIGLFVKNALYFINISIDDRELLYFVWRICPPSQPGLQACCHLPWSGFLHAEPLHLGLEHHLQVWKN